MDNKVVVMGITRMLYGLLSFSAGLLIFYFKDLQQAMKINGFMGSLGPFVFLTLSLIGLAGLASQIEPRKLIMLIAGVALIMLGTR